MLHWMDGAVSRVDYYLRENILQEFDTYASSSLRLWVRSTTSVADFKLCLLLSDEKCRAPLYKEGFDTLREGSIHR